MLIEARQTNKQLQGVLAEEDEQKDPVQMDNTQMQISELESV